MQKAINLKVIDLHKGKKKLAKLKRSLEFSEFTELLGDCLKSEQALLDELIAFWNEKKHELSSPQLQEGERHG